MSVGSKGDTAFAVTKLRECVSLFKQAGYQHQKTLDTIVGRRGSLRAIRC
jgi:hypothetical protein